MRTQWLFLMSAAVTCSIVDCAPGSLSVIGKTCSSSAECPGGTCQNGICSILGEGALDGGVDAESDTDDEATLPGAPTNVTATPWPYTAIVSFSPPAGSGGVGITGYAVTALSAPYIHGQGATSPILVQGGSEQWGGQSYEFVVTAMDSAGTGPPSSPSNAVTPSGGMSPFVVSAGVFYWAEDASQNGHASYDDTSGAPVDGGSDVMFAQSSQGGSWTVFAPGDSFDTSPYSYLQLDLKPTTTGKTWQLGVQNADKQYGNLKAQIDASGAYGPAPAIGQWNTYKVPLADIAAGPGSPNVLLYALSVADSTVGAANVWYFDNVKFTAD